jgi:hypothetical protein
VNPGRGFTLVELVTSLTLAGFAAAFMISTLARQQRFHASAAEILDARAQMRDATGILTADIRAAAVDLGVPAMRDSAIELFTVIASSIVCTTASSQSFGLPPVAPDPGVSLTSMLAMPDTGDLALLYTTGWETHRITSFSTRSMSTACPATTPYAGPADAVSGNPAYAVAIASPVIGSLNSGAPIVFVRRARYSLYRSSDSRWYLGYRRCSPLAASSCGAVQPVSGPYDPYQGGAPGLLFRYFDGAGLELGPSSDGRSLARVDVTLRGRSARKAGLSGDAGSAWQDSVVVSIAMRNRSR